MRSLYLSRPFGRAQRPTWRNPGEIGAISIRRVNGHPHRAPLYISDQVGARSDDAQPPSLRVQSGWHVPGMSYWLRVSDQELLGGTIAPPRPEARKLHYVKTSDRRWRRTPVDHADNGQIALRSLFSDVNHVGADVQDKPRAAFKPAPNFERKCTRCDDSGIDRKPLLHRHSAPRNLRAENIALRSQSTPSAPGRCPQLSRPAWGPAGGGTRPIFNAKAQQERDS